MSVCRSTVPAFRFLLFLHLNSTRRLLHDTRLAARDRKATAPFPGAPARPYFLSSTLSELRLHKGRLNLASLESRREQPETFGRVALPRSLHSVHLALPIFGFSWGGGCVRLRSRVILLLPPPALGSIQKPRASPPLAGLLTATHRRRLSLASHQIFICPVFSYSSNGPDNQTPQLPKIESHMDRGQQLVKNI